MKKLITLLTAVTMVASLAAQKGKKPAAKAAAPAVAAPKAPVAPIVAVEPAKQKAGETSINISVWGGYNLPMKSTYVKYGEGIFSDVSGVTGTNDAKNGGIAGGADFFYGSSFQFGLSAGYLKGHDLTRTLVSSGTTYVFKSSMNYAPILLSVRYFLMPGLYVGAGVGVASVLSGKEGLTSGGVDQTITTADGNSSVNWNFTYSGSGLAVQGRLGYDLPLSQNLTIGLAGIFTYISSELDAGKVVDTSTGGSKIQKIDNSAMHITPALVVTFKF